jgi:hypothetical protein
LHEGADLVIGAGLSVIRGSVRSAQVLRPRTGSRTSANKAANSAPSPVGRRAPSPGVESPNRVKAKESVAVFTKQ